ncbi:MAG: MMPL family transporter, partial [Pseudomonadota bacterium]
MTFIDGYLALVLKHPRKVLLGLALLTLALGWYVKDFSLDASADSLVIEGDADLEFSRLINARYGSNDFVFIAYTPQQALFTSEALDKLYDLKNELQALTGVESVDSIFDVPLFKVAEAKLSNVADNVLTLDTPGVSLEAARADLTTNKAYLDVLLNADGSTTALIVNLVPDARLDELLVTRTTLRNQQRTEGLGADEQQQLRQVEIEYDAERKIAAADLHGDIAAIRETLARYRSDADVVMGGVPMIADDLISFVSSDLKTFGVAILVFIVGALAVLFRRPRYVLIPLICGLVVTVCTMGLLGLMKWPVTVISSNFISLLLITTVSLTIHLIVRYQEMAEEDPHSTHEYRLSETLRDMMDPSLYTCLTTVVAFASLVTSTIPPIIDFGWMMLIGILGGFVLSFLLFPAWMALLPALNDKPVKHRLDITPAIARFTDRWGRQILVVSALLLVFSVVGIRMLRVENSFIDYFDKDTDIYQGMTTIDRQLGGTTPLDVIINLSKPGQPAVADEEDEFADEDEEDSDSYWFTSDKMQLITDIHNYLDAMPETGKVLSLATMLNIVAELNDNKPLNSFQLGVLYTRIPEDYKTELLQPYVSVADNQVRFSIRIRETDETLVRSELLTRIREGLVSNFNLEPEQVQVTGMLVLYNNMLQSLFESQIMTLG